jgi:hypothetical protein
MDVQIRPEGVMKFLRNIGNDADRRICEHESITFLIKQQDDSNAAKLRAK